MVLDAQHNNPNIHQSEIPKNHSHFLAGWRFTALIATVILSMLGYLLASFWGGWSDVKHAFVQVGASGILLVGASALLNYLLRFIRWNHFIALLGYKIPFWKHLRIYIAGFALSATPGKAGEALRSVFLKDFGVPYRSSFGVFLSERIYDLLAVLLVSSWGLWSCEMCRPVVLFAIAAMAVFFYVVQKDRWLRGIEKFLNRRFHNRFSHYVEFCVETIVSLRRCFSPTALLYGTSLGVVAWAIEGVAFAYILHQLGSDISVLTAIFIYGFSLLVGSLTFLPGGLGGAEVAMLKLLMLYDVPASAAVAATITIRIMTLWLSIVLGLIALPRDKIVTHR